MGQLVDGTWQVQPLATTAKDGRFQRADAKFRNWITADGSPGPSGSGGFAAESGRYHLYISHACPWAHRTLIFRRLKGLEPHITVDVVHPDMFADGWTFATDFPGTTGDTLFGTPFARDIYVKAKRDMTGRVTVPILWDKAQNTIVSNESSEIIRMFNSAFDGLTGNTLDFWPETDRDAIEEVNQRIYHSLNNGVYKSGFAASQSAYDAAVSDLFDTLDWLEERLTPRRYLMGAEVTEADWRLFTTLVRFDLVYHTHFKCNRAFLRDYPALWGYTRELYQWQTPAGPIAELVHFDHITRHYYVSHTSINPSRVIPTNPILDWTAPHGREAL